MIPFVCFFSFLFGNWSLKWVKKNGQFEFNHYFIFTVFFVFINCFYYFYVMLVDVIHDDAKNTNPQYLIVYLIYFNGGFLVVNRLTSTGHSQYFANELNKTCGRTVESGRYLPEFWFRMCCSAALMYMYYYKHRTFTDTPTAVIVLQMSMPLACCVLTASTMESQYTAACRALADEFAAVNRMARAATDAGDAETLARASGAHCRLARLVRVYNDEYGVPIFLTTINLLLSQLFSMNDFVAMVIDGDSFETSYVNFEYLFDSFAWTWTWFRFWLICYHVDRLTRQVHLTAKVMLEKDINSYPENTRKLALDFLDQLLHRHVRITAWGFYDINKELLFMILGYQSGLCLICTQFTTSGIQLINSLSTIRKNYSEAVES